MTKTVREDLWSESGRRALSKLSERMKISMAVEFDRYAGIRDTTVHISCWRCDVDFGIRVRPNLDSAERTLLKMLKMSHAILHMKKRYEDFNKLRAVNEN